ncbi:MAG: hypothetical protein ABIC57_04020 [bacterium]
MGFYKLSILTTAFSHLMKIVKETDSVFEIYGDRYWVEEEKVKKIDKEIPYLFSKRKTIKKIQLRKLSMQKFDYKKTLRWLIEEEVKDISIDTFSLLVNDGILKDTAEKLLNTKIVDNRFVIAFRYNTDAGKDDRLRQLIRGTGLKRGIMEKEIEDLGFKIATLDLIGVYAYQDYRKDKKLNILNEINKNENLLREIADQYFKEFITIGGEQRKIRMTKYYEMSKKNMWILKDIKVF